MDVEVVRMSSKGQIVVPLSLRRKFKLSKGEKLILVEEGGMIVVRPVKSLGNDVAEEIHAARRAAAGWKQIKAGNSERMSKAEFLRRLSKW